MNSEFYYLCDLDKKLALDFRQIPEVYGNITGMADLSDQDLASLAWAGQPNIGFLTPSAANAMGMSVDSMEVAFHLGAQAKRTYDKSVRDERVSRIKVVTVAGHQFDGDEVSQGRMARAIISMQAADRQHMAWVLSDNSVIEATVAELSEALALASAAQAEIWQV